MGLIDGLLSRNIMNEKIIKISDNLIIFKNEMFTGTVISDKQKNTYTILLYKISVFVLNIVYYQFIIIYYV